MNIKEQVERGTLRLHPMPTSVNYEDGDYQRTMIINKKNGSHFEILRLTRGQIAPDIRVYGDIPILKEDVEDFVIAIKQKSLFHCEVKEMHEHETTRDAHPKCNFHSDKQFTEIFPEIFKISQGFSDANAKKTRESMQH